MIRDFTDEAKQTFYALPKTITPLAAVTDLMNTLEDVDKKIKSISFWGPALDALVFGVSGYIGQFTDLEGRYQGIIDNIFANVSDVEEDYGLRLETVNESMQADIEQFRELAQMIAPDSEPQLKQKAMKLKHTRTNHYALRYGQVLIQGCKVWDRSEMQAEVENYIDTMTQHRYNGNDNVKGMNNAEVQSFVYLYEYLHPDVGEKMDNLLETGKDNPLTQEDKDKIKYIAYTADEPYRSLYLEYAGTYKIGAFGVDEFGYTLDKAKHDWSTNALYFVDGTSDFSEDKRGPYTTWFHESGHATDMNAGVLNEAYSRTYNAGSLEQAIREDVKKNISSKIENYTSNEETKDKILATFFNGGDVSGLGEREMSIRDDVISQYKEGGPDYLGEPYAEAACDIYGGVTNLVIDVDGGYGHWKEYWYREDGSPTLNQCTELFAEYFSYYMTGNDAAIESMRIHLSTACEVLDEMIESMVRDLESRE